MSNHSKRGSLYSPHFNRRKLKRMVRKALQNNNLKLGTRYCYCFKTGPEISDVFAFLAPKQTISIYKACERNFK